MKIQWIRQAGHIEEDTKFGFWFEIAPVEFVKLDDLCYLSLGIICFYWFK